MLENLSQRQHLPFALGNGFKAFPGQQIAIDSIRSSTREPLSGCPATSLRPARPVQHQSSTTRRGTTTTTARSWCSRA